MFDYQKTNRYFAQIADGLEEVGAAELAELGATKVMPIYRGIHFNADKAALYRVNYCSRLLSKVMAPLATFKCYSPEDLYDRAREIDWSSLMDTATTFAIFSNVSSSNITHSKYAALKLKDAIADHFRDKTGSRPSVDTENPGVWFHVFIHKNVATISLEASGGALHKRGYRTVGTAAPMHETLAAAIIRLSEWDGERPLYDPMCGSGTILCEALMKYSRIPAGWFRKRFGFENLPDFSPGVWREVKKDADSQMRPPEKGFISGSDAAHKAVQAAGDNCRALPYGELIGLKVSAFERLKGIENSVIVCNPPAGIRIGAAEGIDVFTKSFGDFLKQKCKGSTAYIYFHDKELVKKIGLRTTWKKPLKNGAIDGRLIKIELY